MSTDDLLANSGNAAWMLMAASLVLLMTPGLAFFYGGMSRSKSVLNMMMMSFGAMAVIGVIYVLWGWSMSYGTENIGGIFANPFEFFGLKNSITDADGNFIAGAWGYPNVIDIAFQVTFAIITTALISGALAERVKFGTWLLFSGIWVTVVYFPLSHMVWGGGLLSGSRTASRQSSSAPRSTTTESPSPTSLRSTSPVARSFTSTRVWPVWSSPSSSASVSASARPPSVRTTCPS